MNRALGIALLVAGAVMIYFGVGASNSISSNVSRTISGTPTNHTLWLLIGGIAVAVVGLLLTLMGWGGSKTK